MTTKKRKLNRGLDALLGAELTTKTGPVPQLFMQALQGKVISVRSRWNSCSAVNTNRAEILMRAHSMNWQIV